MLNKILAFFGLKRINEEAYINIKITFGSKVSNEDVIKIAREVIDNVALEAYFQTESLNKIYRNKDDD
jgi:hypothetical protein